ncbi:coagulation factor IX-like [Copidosoma floridanum]|uniref:coagulation factor IX-like n=1 Tax=Copidosoma floridanum TaxID=29053 RepID=UPI000C6F94B5|nr:coagulation factor IX-like [Copidosoma floridanum]
MSYIYVIAYSFAILYLSNKVETLQTENINGGKITTIEEYPHHVFVTTERKICNGAIISEWNVITAAHCIENKNREVIANAVTIIAGVSNYKNNSTFKFVAVAEKIYLPTDIELISVTGMHEVDIAVIKLDKAIPLDNVHLKKITLPDQYVNLDSEFYIDTEPILTGFGYNKITTTYSNGNIHVKGRSTGDLRFSKTRVLSLKECLKTRPLGTVDFLKKFCSKMKQPANMEPKGACLGDRDMG